MRAPLGNVCNQFQTFWIIVMIEPVWENESDAGVRVNTLDKQSKWHYYRG